MCRDDGSEDRRSGGSVSCLTCVVMMVVRIDVGVEV